MFLWGVEALNLLRILLQVVTSTEASHPALWNWLWIGTRFGLELLEVSVVVFLLQGYLRTGREVRPSSHQLHSVVTQWSAEMRGRSGQRRMSSCWSNKDVDRLKSGLVCCRSRLSFVHCTSQGALRQWTR